MTCPDFLPNSTDIEVADLIIDGLAACCFNPDKVWEVAYLREPHHELKIKATKKTLAGGITTDPPYTFPVPMNFSRLEILVDNGPVHHQYDQGYYFSSPDFTREICHDPRDFRWVIDFTSEEVDHGSFVGLKPQPDNVTLLKVANSLFYTKTLTSEPVLILPRHLKDPCEGLILGHTNALVGACVLAQTPSRILIKGQEKDKPMRILKELEYEADHYYEIEMKNMDTEKLQRIFRGARKKDLLRGAPVKGYREGDFGRFYDVIGVTGTEKSLWGSPNVLRGKLGDCHMVRVDSAKVSTLEPLLAERHKDR